MTSVKNPPSPKMETRVEPASTETEGFLQNLYSLCSKNEIEDALDLVFDVIDDGLLAGNFAVCDTVLSEIELKRINVQTMLCILTITHPAKDQLSNRKTFYSSVEKFLQSERTTGEIKQLLHGLE